MRAKFELFPYIHGHTKDAIYLHETPSGYFGILLLESVTDKDAKELSFGDIYFEAGILKVYNGGSTVSIMRIVASSIPLKGIPSMSIGLIEDFKKVEHLSSETFMDFDYYVPFTLGAEYVPIEEDATKLSIGELRLTPKWAEVKAAESVKPISPRQQALADTIKAEIDKLESTTESLKIVLASIDPNFKDTSVFPLQLVRDPNDCIEVRGYKYNDGEEYPLLDGADPDPYEIIGIANDIHEFLELVRYEI